MVARHLLSGNSLAMSSMQRAIEKQPVESEDKAVNSVAGRVASDKVDCIVKVAPRPIDLEARLLRKKSRANADWHRSSKHHPSFI
ncbi:MAG: hypothetical protein P8P54_12140 [Pseudomonadales bacterium]|nr:hypothetical protein [Pseudomonadales bacterium]MDG1304916.1 hypothetical protein [Pseudomonadales bacterium]